MKSPVPFEGVATDPVIPLCRDATRLHLKMESSYYNLYMMVRHSSNEGAIRRAQAQADAIGRRYQQLCERIYNTRPMTLQGLLAKIRCATRCVRDALPRGADPEAACDIEVRFVLALERDLDRMLSMPIKARPATLNEVPVNP